MLAALACLGALVAACDMERRPGDTQGEQRAARWEWYGRLVVETDSVLTLVRIRIDTTVGRDERHDVLLSRFDFDPTLGPGDEYALALGVDLGNVRALPLNEPLVLGSPGGLPAVASVTRLGTPLRPDSVRGTLVLTRRGLRQFAGRVDARLYFTAWNDPDTKAVYELRQVIHGVK